MAEAVSIFPNIFTAIDPLLEEEAALFIDDELSEEESVAYGQTLAYDWANLRVRLATDGTPLVVSGQEALLEDVLKALLTPRYEVTIYSSDYGCELQELIGLPQPTALAQIEAMVRETITNDNRVQTVDEITVRAAGSDGAYVRVVIRDFNGLLLSIPEVMIRYG